MDEKKISDLIYDWLDYMYCDNCRYDSELHDDGYGGNPCECCYRKYNGWGVSRGTADLLAKKIVGMNEGEGNG